MDRQSRKSDEVQLKPWESIMHTETVAWASVYKNVKSKELLVIAKVVGATGRAEIGEPIRVSDAEVESAIANILLRTLDSFQTNVYSLEATRPKTEEEYQTFRKHHLRVSVERRSSGDIILLPLHRIKGGYAGKYAEQVVVSKEEVPDKIASALQEAFSLAR